MSRQDQYSVHVIVDGQDTGVWDKMTGGAVDSEESTYKPGGMAPSKVLGSTTETGTVTVSRLYDLNRDHNGLVQTLLATAGRARVSINKQPLDVNGVPFGSPLTYNGVLKSCAPPEVDSESADAALLAIEVSIEGIPA